MTKEISKKVVNIFEKIKDKQPIESEANIVTCEDGICCVCMQKDENGNYFDENHLLECAAKMQYIIRVMIENDKHPYLYNYKVPGEKLVEFMNKFHTGEKQGAIIEVERYYTGELA